MPQRKNPRPVTAGVGLEPQPEPVVLHLHGPGFDFRLRLNPRALRSLLYVLGALAAAGAAYCKAQS